MKTKTLHSLVDNFENERRYLEACALLVSNEPQVTRCEQRAGTIAPIVTNLRAEITARANPSQRNPDEARRFDDYLQSVLEIHLELEPTHSGMQEHQAA